MSLSIALTSLRSRASRTASTGGSGIRRIATDASKAIQKAQQQEPTNFWDGLTRFGASLLGTLMWQPPWVKFTVGGLVNWFVNTVQQLTHFNWNSTDAQLDEQIKQQEIAVAAAEGGLRGQIAGRLICGIAPTAGLAVFNEALALHVLMKVGEEAAEEIAASASRLMTLIQRKTVNTAFINIYKNYRSVLRPAALGVATMLKTVGVLDQDSIDKANKQRDKPWSFHSALEDTIDNVKDPIAKAKLEEFWDEFGDACIESGYIIAGSIDSYFIHQKTQEEAARTSTHTVIMSPSGAIPVASTSTTTTSTTP